MAFANAGVTSAISGNSTFNNLNFQTVSKSATFAQGSTQTVSGKLLIDGGAFATRISFASTGGAGTTWNLVLNGMQDCRYVAVQGSNASGTAFLPINPVGYKNNWDNTNWYDSSLPSEMLFYDDFETSTLGSAPPDKTSSYWNIDTASWLDQAAVVVNTQNNTTGGSQSMYSSGGVAGDGIGAWNSPAWGPQTNCTAEGWFYDDMQNNKMQWIFVDNAAGNQGTGVLVETNLGQGQTKYRYCRFGFGDGTLYADSYIDRTLGWHKVKWVHTEGTVELYLDGALLMTAVGLEDFSDFDTGSWTWHNTTGSTPMWFDDFSVYRSQHQSVYRWYDNNNAENPLALAAEDTAITRNIGTVTRLRIQITNDTYEDWSGDYIGLQYREGSNGTWQALGPTEDWDYADGLGEDKTLVGNALLSGTDVLEYFVESVPSLTNLTMTNNQRGEWDFCVVPTTNATIGAVYYLRLVTTDPAGNFARSMAAYLVIPECTVYSPTVKVWDGSSSSDWNDPDNWTGPGVPDNTFDVIIPAGTPACRIDDLAVAQCKSLLVQDGASLLLDTAATSLTVTENLTVYGTVTHSDANASLTLSSGTLRVEGATAVYNHTGSGTLDASNAAIQVINGGSYNVSGTPTISAQTLSMAVGGLVDVTNAATFNLEDFNIVLNGQWLSSDTGNIVNVTGNFVNNGSMLGSTGGDFRFTGAGKTMSGTSTTTTFYRTTFSGTMTSSITNDVKVLDNLTVNGGASFTSGAGNLLVSGNWANSGTYGHGSGTVIFNGTALQTVQSNGSSWNKITQTNSSAGGVSFTDGFTAVSLENTTADSLMTFTAGQTYNVTAAAGLTLNGTAGQTVNLRSSTPGTRWMINPSGGTWNVDYVDVQDSFNTYSDPIMPTNSTDSTGNCINWFIKNQDSDNNELADWWEYYYYGTIGNDPALDTDSDELNTFIEYVLDTNPTVANVNIVWVDSSTLYLGNDGSTSNPYKYLSDALTAATEKDCIRLKAGTYTLDDYSLSKNVVIKPEKGANEVIIQGPRATGGTSDNGQMLRVSSKRFILSDVTIRNYKEDQPLISYEVGRSQRHHRFPESDSEGKQHPDKIHDRADGNSEHHATVSAEHPDLRQHGGGHGGPPGQSSTRPSQHGHQQHGHRIPDQR